MPPQIDGTWTLDYLWRQELHETTFQAGKSIYPGHAHGTLNMWVPAFPLASKRKDKNVAQLLPVASTVSERDLNFALLYE